jgi:hypothetical protein
VVGLLDQTTRNKGDGYAPAAELVRAQARPGDVVVMSDPRGLWAFMWDYAGPGWGDYLRVRFADNPKSAAMDAKLPPALRARLAPGRLRYDVGGVEVVLLPTDAPLPRGPRRVISVSTDPSWPAPQGAPSARLIAAPLDVAVWPGAGGR